MNLKKMMMASALLMVACCMQAQTKVIAHRGFWKTPGSSQNSISSLQQADSLGCYGSEFGGQPRSCIQDETDGVFQR